MMPFAQLVLLKAAVDAALEEEKRRREKVATEAKNRAWRKILAAAKTRLKNRAQSQQRCRIETDCCYDVASSRIVFRYYDPRQKRFVSADPLGRGATPDLYGYANGDPVNMVDPLGLDPEFHGEEGSGIDNELDVVEILPAVSSAVTIKE